MNEYNNNRYTNEQLIEEPVRLAPSAGRRSKGNILSQTNTRYSFIIQFHTDFFLFLARDKSRISYPLFQKLNFVPVRP